MTVHEKLKKFFDELDIKEEHEDKMFSLLSDVYMLEMTKENLSNQVSELSWYKHPDTMGNY